MAFSLSPAVTVKEWDLSANVPAVTSARTGVVIRADKGPAMQIVSVTNEADLVAKFGKPTAANYQDWFQAWNFLQYASSLYVVRPMDTAKATKNAGVTLSGSSVQTQISTGSLYNSDIAESTIAGFTGDTLTVWNRELTSDQRLAVAVCSSSANFTKPIGTEFTATISASGSVGASAVSASSATHGLIAGSKFILKEKQFTVTSVVGVTINLDQAIATSDFLDTFPATITGCNLYNTIYDESLITKTRTSLADGLSVITESLVTFDKLVEFAPVWASDEFQIVILQKNSDNKFEMVESKIVSYVKGGRDSNGRNNFAEDAFFNGSKYAYVHVGSETISANKVETAAIAPVKILGDAASAITYPISNGAYSGTSYTKGDIQTAQLMFADSESFDINILVAHEKDIDGASTIAESRKDCMAVVAPVDAGEITYLVTNSNSDCATYLCNRYGSQQAFATKIFNTFGTYSAVYGNVKYQYDKFNDVNRWICVAGDIAGLYASTDSNRDTWWAPAGGERGKIKNAIKLAFNPNKQNKDDLYVNSINPIVSVPGEGNAVVYGQKTATSKASAFDRINVRRLLIFLEKSIATASRSGLFEFNDAFTRARLFGQIDPFLRTIKSRRGLYDYKLVIDDTNNTSEVIDQNGLVIDVYLKPTKVAEFIAVNAVVVKTGVSFNEVVGKFGG